MQLLFAKTLVLLAALSIGFKSVVGCHPRTGVAIDVTNNSARLLWSTSTCSSVTGYAIYLANSTSTLDDPDYQEFVANITRENTYSLSNLNPGSVYYYRVRPYISGTRLNTISRGITVNTAQVPSILGITSITATSLYVIWTTCSGASRYYIDYRSSSSSYWRTVEVGDVRSNQITNLLPSTTYQFRVQCASASATDIIRGPYSSRQFATTLVDPDILQPTKLNVMFNSTNTSVVVTWEPAGLEISHEVLVSNGGQQQTCTAWSGQSACTVVNLQPETVYSFQVRAVSLSGDRSSWSTPLTGITLPLYPGEDVNVTLNETTASTISVSWTRIRFRVDWYMLRIQSVPAENLPTVEVAVVNSTERYTFHDLLPLTDYTITMWAVNKAGSGPQSTLNATTTNALESSQTDLIISTSVLATLLAVLILCVVIVSTFVLLLRWRKGKKRDSGSGASNQIKFSTEVDEVDMEGNAAYATIEYRWHHHDDYHEETMSTNDQNVLIRPLQIPPRIRTDEAIPTIPVQPSQISEPVYADSESFQKYSGWFMPSVNEVLCNKLGLDDDGFVKLGSGIFYMFHKTNMTAKYVGFAANLPVTLCDIINNLYKKEMSGMTAIEVELKYFSPKAEDWIVQVWQCEKEVLLVERAKWIIEKQTLRPHGLNKCLKIKGRQGWEEFAKWYTHTMKTQK